MNSTSRRAVWVSGLNGQGVHETVGFGVFEGVSRMSILPTSTVQDPEASSRDIAARPPALDAIILHERPWRRPCGSPGTQMGMRVHMQAAAQTGAIRQVSAEGSASAAFLRTDSMRFSAAALRVVNL
jgi:hypothetical protein